MFYLQIISLKNVFDIFVSALNEETNFLKKSDDIYKQELVIHLCTKKQQTQNYNFRIKMLIVGFKVK